MICCTSFPISDSGLEIEKQLIDTIPWKLHRVLTPERHSVEHTFGKGRQSADAAQGLCRCPQTFGGIEA